MSSHFAKSGTFGLASAGMSYNAKTGYSRALEEIGETLREEDESLNYSSHGSASMAASFATGSMGGSLNFRLTSQTKLNLAQKLQNLPQVKENL